MVDFQRKRHSVQIWLQLLFVKIRTQKYGHSCPYCTHYPEKSDNPVDWQGVWGEKMLLLLEAVRHERGRHFSERPQCPARPRRKF